MTLPYQFREWWRKLRRRLGNEPVLCHNCKYNNPRDCRHRTRPYARICEDYRRR